MEAVIRLYSLKEDEINSFLNKFYGIHENRKDLEYEIVFTNPVEAATIVGTFIDNNTEINMWISLDKNFFINVTDYNADKIIRYLFERYPY